VTAQLIDGNALAKQIRGEVQGRTEALKARGVQPHLAIVLVGEDPASQVYVKHKVADSEQTGLKATLERYPATMTEAELLARIRALNGDPASAGALMVGQPGFWPCTPYGCLKMLDSIGYDLKGKHAVVIGRSNIVGKPMAMMLLGRDATVTICHSRTSNLKALTLQADVVVAAVGRRNVLTADMVKPGAVVIDVGMNRNDEGKLCGDVDFEGVKQVASWITPVPGGVGPMTRAMLLVNTIEAAERTAGV
jgi:methylenetetrahydrofolate dehydrogenase (NADP+)/methenyltetrahydrofolate cyclohydrolase